VVGGFHGGAEQLIDKGEHMNTWSPQDARAITGPEQVQVVTGRRDGGPRHRTTIWIVGDGERIFIRSTNGRTAAWFRGAIATGTGQVIAAGTAYDVVFTEADDDLGRVDAAYRAKYGRYASIVDHLEEAGPRAATLQVHPA
jgi:hypothetical protein